MVSGPNTAAVSMKLAISFADRQIVDTRVTPGDKTTVGKLRILVAISAVPLSAVVVPFVGNPIHDKCPQLLGQAIVQFPRRLACQE
jgi:hypothetical protein